jgi:hypothetical protein
VRLLLTCINEPVASARSVGRKNNKHGRFTLSEEIAMPKPDVTVLHAASRVPLAPQAKPEEAAPKRSFIAEATAKAAKGDTVNPETTHQMIAEAAYYCAEKRGFAPGGELQDWLCAEAEVTASLH